MSGQHKSYVELLRDPRWQRKRLEVLSREKFRCEDCYSNEKTLNVHHSVYRKGAAPWEYEDEELVVLCEDCHKAWHEDSDRVRRALSHLPSFYRQELLGYAEAVGTRDGRYLNTRRQILARMLEAPRPGYAAGVLAAIRSEYDSPDSVLPFVTELLQKDPYSSDDLWALSLTLIALGERVYLKDLQGEFWKEFEHNAQEIDDAIAGPSRKASA